MEIKMIYKCLNPYLQDYVKGYVGKQINPAALPECPPSSWAIDVPAGKAYMVGADGQWAQFGGGNE